MGISSLSTDLHCYFGCEEVFKKDFQAKLHYRMQHRNEDASELTRAVEYTEEEISFTRRSACIYECAICRKRCNEQGVFYNHIKSQHNMPWKAFEKIYGKCEVESTSFECKICGSVVKYTSNYVRQHLRLVHRINWVQYLDRIRKMSKGEQPEDLPSVQIYECKICSTQVKGLKDHIWNVHRLTETGYQERLDQIQQGIAPDELPSIETFGCKVCGATVKYLREHLKNNHKISEAEYKEVYS